MVGNYSFTPSEIEDEIYEMMDDYMVGMDIYEYGLIDAIIDYFCNHIPSVQWRLCYTPWPDIEGGVCSVAWIEDGNIQMITFDYKGAGN